MKLAPGESAAVLARLQSGHQQALAELFMGHRQRLRRMVHRRLDTRLLRRVDASDIIQEGFVDAARRLDEYLTDPSMPFFLWLRFLVKQRLVDVHRRHFGTKKRDPRREQPPSAHMATGDVSSVVVEDFAACLTTPSQAVARAELQRRVREIIDRLDPLDREMLALRHFEELSNNETAIELGLSKSAASKRYIRAVQRLRKAVAPLLHSLQDSQSHGNE